MSGSTSLDIPGVLFGWAQRYGHVCVRVRMEAEDVSELEPSVLPKSPMLGRIGNGCSSYARL